MTRVAVDLLYYTGKRGGTETYIREVLPRIAALLPEITFVGIVNTTARDKAAVWFPGELRTCRVSGENRPIWALTKTFGVAPLARRLGADLLWCPANFGPGRSRVPRLVTVHDVIAFEYPNAVSALTRLITRWIIRGTARGARRLLTDSEGSADAIVRVLGIERERITAVPLAAGQPPEFDAEARFAALALLGLDRDRPYVLSTGNRLPHKNFDGLLRALATIPAVRRPRLVVTGSHGGIRSSRSWTRWAWPTTSCCRVG